MKKLSITFSSNKCLKLLLKSLRKHTKNTTVEIMNNLFSPFISAYRESHNIQHVLIRFIEEWKKNLYNSYFIGTVLMDLSKAFDCIPHDLAIVKLAAYGSDKNMICYIYSYLKSRKQGVSVNNIKSTFEGIISGVPQDSIVGPILFSIFFLLFKKGNQTNRNIKINQKEIKAVAKVKLLDIEIDDKLNFNHHINSICKSVSNQLYALI